MSLLFLLQADAFTSNRETLVKMRKQFSKGGVSLGLGAVVQPEFSARRQNYKEKEKDVEGINPFFSISDTKIYLDALYKKEKFSVGYLIRMAPRINKIEVDRNYMELNWHDVGVFQAGHNKAAYDLMSVKLAQKVMPTIWLDGAMGEQVNSAKTVFGGNDFVGHAGVAMKLNWMTKAWRGLQVGLTYTPETKAVGQRGREYFAFGSNDKDKGNQGVWNEKHQPFGRHSISGAVVYAHSFDVAKSPLDLTVAGAVIGEALTLHQDAKDGENLDRDAVRNTFGWMLSAAVKYAKFAVGIEYWDSGRSRLPKKEVQYGADTDRKPAIDFGKFQAGHAGRAINLAMSYKVADGHTVALAGQYSWRSHGVDKDNLAAVRRGIVTAAYAWKFVECATWYTEFDYVIHGGHKADKTAYDAGSLNKNHGWTVMTGVRVEI